MGTMAPVIKQEIVEDDTAMSKTDQYRKVMKPMIERKRRARINACLDELKDLMVFAQKADVLELTVSHLRKLKRQQMLTLNPALDLDRFHAGYTTCATEVSRSLASTGVDVNIGSRLMGHLGHRLNTIEKSRIAPLTVRVPDARPAPKLHRMEPPSSDGGYSSGRDSTPSPQPLLQISPAYSHSSPSHLPSSPVANQSSPVWRPF